MSLSRQKQIPRLIGQVYRAAACVAAVFAVAAQAEAAPKTWIGANGDFWDDGTKWNPAGQPVAGDDVSLTQNAAANETVNYRSKVNPALSSLLIEGTGGGQMLLSQGQDALTAANGTVARTGKGVVDEFGGTQEFTQNLTIGDMAGAVGTFTLTGDAKLNVKGNEIIGNSGKGSFTQSLNAMHTVGGVLTLGNNFLGGNGTYTLLGGKLTTAGTDVGDAGTGVFTQMGGMHVSTGGVLLGKTAFLGFGGNGTYNLNGGLLNAGTGTVVGLQGKGKFVQTGGTHQTDTLILGSAAAANGTYQLGGGSIDVKNNLLVGDSGTGTFTQAGGMQTVSGAAIIGNMAGSTGMYTLSSGAVTMKSTETIGNSGSGKFIQTGGTNTAGISLYMGYLAGSTGNYSLTGDSTLAVTGNELIGNFGNATFVQGNGKDVPTHTIGQSAPGSGGSLTLGDGLGTGNYTLNSGKLMLDGDETIGNFGTGVFKQNGGTHAVGGTLTLGAGIGGGRFGDGELDLNGGSVTVAKDANIGVKGAGRVKVDGGDLKVAGTITTKTLAGAAGSLSLSSGSVEAAKIVNNDSLGYFGGNLKADITNNAFFSLSGAGQRVVNGNVTNTAAGSITVSNTKVKWNGKFVDNGKYTSDPSENDFNDLTVGSTGYLQGGAGDVFSIAGNFANASVQATNWQTSTAELTFAGEGPHSFDFNAADLGAVAAGYTDNFAWGLLLLQPGTILDVSDTHPGSKPAALYTSVFDVTGDDINEVNDIFSNYNIYYDPTQAGNNYLDDKNYQLAGAGCLIAIGNDGPCQTAVPEPPTAWPLLAGLLGLFLARRRLS